MGQRVSDVIPRYRIQQECLRPFVHQFRENRVYTNNFIMVSYIELKIIFFIFFIASLLQKLPIIYQRHGHRLIRTVDFYALVQFWRLIQITELMPLVSGTRRFLPYIQLVR